MKYQQIAKSFFDLDSRSIHVWSVSTMASSDVSARFEQMLSPAERDRANRLRIDHIRHSFIVARGALRVLLGGYLSISPTSVEFAYCALGKPVLAARRAIDFNKSSSGNLAVFAFTTDCELGVDIERIRPIPDLQDIANRFFCSEEAMELMTLPPQQREHSFFSCWTRKEAYLKATAEGLSAPLDSFRVTLRPAQTARLLKISGDVHQWTLHDLELDTNYAAALAYRDSERPVSIRGAIDAADLLDS